MKVTKIQQQPVPLPPATILLELTEEEAYQLRVIDTMVMLLPRSEPGELFGAQARAYTREQLESFLHQIDVRLGAASIVYR